MTSVVIAAHNEAAVIERCLASLLADAASGEFDVIVVANGCTDNTARLAERRPGVRVVEIPEASKPKRSTPEMRSRPDFPVCTSMPTSLRVRMWCAPFEMHSPRTRRRPFRWLWFHAATSI